RPGGDFEYGRAARVINAIRVRTGDPLKSVEDTEPIPPGTVLRIPTFRELPRAVLSDLPALTAALAAAGYDHANKLLQRTPQSVVGVLGPYTKEKPYTAADVNRAYALTALLDLDGMDVRTALHLFGAASIHSLADLAAQSEASLQKILESLVK